MTPPAPSTITWGPAYELGIEDIDFQHHYFANLINRLTGELGRTDDAVYRQALLAELNAYARFHFTSEENLMHRAGFPGLAEHRRLHQRLVDDLSAREAALLMHHSAAGAEGVVHFLIEWFLGHTTVEDRHFADFLRA